MIYTYESLKQGDHRVFEIQQSMQDKALTEHPDLGIPIRRIITGGSGFKKTCFAAKRKLSLADCKGSSGYQAAVNKPLTVAAGGI